MKENKIERQVDKPIDVVKFYYSRYKEYVKAYNKVKEESGSLNDTLKQLTSNGVSSEKTFKDAALEYIQINSMYSNEVMFASNKFLNAADFYMKIDKNDLPEDVTKEYVLLKNQEFKSGFSVKDNKFIRNSKVEPREIPQEEFDYLFEYLKQQLK